MTAGYSFANRTVIASIDTNQLLSLDGFVVNSIATREQFILDLNATSGDITPTGGNPGFWLLLNGGTGDMLKAEYDPNDNGWVELAAAIVGVSASANNTSYGKNSAGVVGFHARGTGGGSAGTIEDNGITVNVETLTGNKTLASTDPIIHILDPGTADRDVLIPTTPADNHRFVVQHNGSANSLFIKDDTTTIIELTPTDSEFYLVEGIHKDSNWYYQFYKRESLSTAPPTNNTGIQQVGDNSQSSFIISNSMATRNIDVLVWDNNSKLTVEPTITVTPSNITIDFGSEVPTVNQYNVVGYATNPFGHSVGTIIGDASTTVFGLNHGFTKDDLFTVLLENGSTNQIVWPESFTRPDTDNVDVTFTSSPPVSTDYTLIVYGDTAASNLVVDNTVGDGSATTINITHNLNTEAVKVEVYENASGNETVLPQDIDRVSVNEIAITFSSAPALDEYSVVILNTLGA